MTRVSGGIKHALPVVRGTVVDQNMFEVAKGLRQNALDGLTEKRRSVEKGRYDTDFGHALSSDTLTVRPTRPSARAFLAFSTSSDDSASSLFQLASPCTS